MKKKTKKYEPKLKLAKVDQFSDAELLKFTFNRGSFFRDYKLLHNRGEVSVRKRLGLVLSYVDICELAREIRLCFSSVLSLKQRQTFRFNQYVINLIEMHYSNELFSSKCTDISPSTIIEMDYNHVSYEWVMFCNTLNLYQRYLLFEYLILGYSLEDLGRRRYCTSRTISNHLNIIIEVLGQ